MSWTNRETAARESIGMGVSHVFDRCMDMISFAANLQMGEIFYVDGAYGLDTYDGLTPTTAKKTLTAGLGLVTDNKQDLVFVRNYGNQSTEDYPIDGTTWKKRCHIIGVEGYGGRFSLIDSNDADTSAVDFSTTQEFAGSSFENMAFATSGSSTVAAVDFGSNMWYVTFKNCAFGWSGETARYGIYQSAGDAPHLVIDGCWFWGDSLNVAAIQLLGSSTRARIVNNHFIGILTGDYGITDSGGTGLMNVQIQNNDFSIHTESANGQAIYLTGSGHCSVNGNVAYNGSGLMSYNPYRDTGTNDWGLNYKAGVSTYPATS